MKRTSVIAFAIVAAWSAAAPGQIGRRGDLLDGTGTPSFLAEPERISAAAVPEYQQATPGQSFHVAVDVRIGANWAYYSPVPGEFKIGGRPQAAGIDAQADELSVGEALWPADKAYQDGARVYKKRAIVILPVTVPADLPGGEYELKWRLFGQICNSVDGQCVPLEGQGDVSGTLPVRVAPAAKLNQAWQSDEAFAGAAGSGRTAKQIKAERDPDKLLAIGEARRQWPVLVALGLALVAGLILNVMPCVLPVIPLRIYSVVQMAGESRRRFVTLGLAFALGIVLFFAGIGAVNVILYLARGQAFRWSEQWQQPGVIAAMIVVLVAVAANLFGLYTVTVPQKIAGLEAREGGKRGAHARSMGMGLMMAILATPCSFGLLLGVLGWAQTAPLVLGTLTLVVIGVGMAAPHALLVAFPKLVNLLPKPGVWMERFKQSMGFVILLVAVYVASWLGGKSYAFWVVGYGIVLSFCLWVWGGWVRFDAPLKRKIVVRGLMLALAFGAGIYMLRPPAPLPDWAIKFRPFDLDEVTAAREDGRIVVVKFTADWCGSCALVDRAVYRQRDVAEKFAELDVYAVKGDVTLNGSPADKFFKKWQGIAVPVTAVYLPGRDEAVLLKSKFDKSKLIKLLAPAGG